MSKLDQSPSEGNTPKKKTCLEMLHSILDGEATPDQRKEFVEKHLNGCMPCFQKYHLEMAIRDLLKSKCCNHEAPAELIQNIKSMINTVD